VTLREVVRLRPSFALAYELMAMCLAYLGRLNEASAMMERIPARSSEQFRRYQRRPPWIRPEDYTIRQEARDLIDGYTITEGGVAGHGHRTTSS